MGFPQENLPASRVYSTKATSPASTRRSILRVLLPSETSSLSHDGSALNGTSRLDARTAELWRRAAEQLAELRAAELRAQSSGLRGGADASACGSARSR